MMHWLSGLPVAVGWIVAACVTAAGWLVRQSSSVRLFRNQVRNAARGDIVAAIRARDDELARWSAILVNFKVLNAPRLANVCRNRDPR